MAVSLVERSSRSHATVVVGDRGGGVYLLGMVVTYLLVV